MFSHVARELGAHQVHRLARQDLAGELQDVGVARVILATAVDAEVPISPETICRSIGSKGVRNAVIPYWHFSVTAKLGNDPWSVVGSDLCVHGMENLRVADASIMPRITSGNTMAPCVVIGERAAECIRDRHSL
jgi:choline dehydrogenase-like flavoprotein